MHACKLNCYVQRHTIFLWLGLFAPNVMAIPGHVPRAAPAVVLRPRYRVMVVDRRPLRCHHPLHHSMNCQLLSRRCARSHGANVDHGHGKDEQVKKFHGDRSKGNPSYRSKWYLWFLLSSIYLELGDVLFIGREIHRHTDRSSCIKQCVSLNINLSIYLDFHLTVGNGALACGFSTQVGSFWWGKDITCPVGNF